MRKTWFRAQRTSSPFTAIAKANDLTNNSPIRTWTTASSSHRSSLCFNAPLPPSVPLPSHRRATLILLMLAWQSSWHAVSVDIDCGSLFPENKSSAVRGGIAPWKASRPPSFLLKFLHPQPVLIFSLFCDDETVRLGVIPVMDQ
jgi:hypothetical protein